MLPRVDEEFQVLLIPAMGPAKAPLRRATRRSGARRLDRSCPPGAGADARDRSAPRHLDHCSPDATSRRARAAPLRAEPSIPSVAPDRGSGPVQEPGVSLPVVGMSPRRARDRPHRSRSPPGRLVGVDPDVTSPVLLAWVDSDARDGRTGMRAARRRDHAPIKSRPARPTPAGDAQNRSHNPHGLDIHT